MGKTFTQRLQELYQDAPERHAIHLLFNRQPDLSLTYRDILHGSAGYARAMQQAGIQPGEVVILILEHGKDLLFAFYGAILHGAVPSIMPFLTEKLSPDKYREALAALFDITAPSAVITYAEFQAEVERAIRPGSTVRAVLVSDQVHPDGAIDFSSLGGLQCNPEDVVLLQHSSGTTGLQKGVALSHQAVFNQIESYAEAIQLTSEDIIVSWLPLYHDMGLIAGFIMPLLAGVPLVLMSPFDWVRAPYKLLQAISKYRGSLTWLPNFAYNFCAQKIRERDLEGVDLSSWRAVINCSEPMHWKSHQLFSQRFEKFNLSPAALATCYAMAENVFAVTQGGIDEPVVVDRISQPAFLNEGKAQPCRDGDQEMILLSAGRPIRGTEVCVLDDKMEAAPDRQLGEIALRSNCVLTGYYNRPDLTSKAFHDGWYLTGDLGYLADGELYVTGRKKDLIIVGGKNVYPQDLERLASEVPGVHPGRVVAFGVFNEDTGTEDVVIIAERQAPDDNVESSLDSYQIADDVRRRVTHSSDIALRYVKIVERGWLLKTSSGKMARSANREKYLAELAIEGEG